MWSAPSGCLTACSRRRPSGPADARLGARPRIDSSLMFSVIIFYRGNCILYFLISCSPQFFHLMDLISINNLCKSVFCLNLGNGF